MNSGYMMSEAIVPCIFLFGQILIPGFTLTFFAMTLSPIADPKFLTLTSFPLTIDIQSALLTIPEKMQPDPMMEFSTKAFFSIIVLSMIIEFLTVPKIVQLFPIFELLIFPSMRLFLPTTFFPLRSFISTSRTSQGYPMGCQLVVWTTRISS